MIFKKVVLVIPLAYTSACPNAVMVETQHTVIAITTMGESRWSIHLTCWAEFHPEEVRVHN